MARKERNNIDYFPHPVTHGKKMFYLRSKYGNDGYAIWFRLLEELGKADYHYLDLKDEVQIMYLSSEFAVSEDVLKEVIKILVRFNEFDRYLWEKDSILFNEKFVESIEDAYKKRNNPCITKKSLLGKLLANGRLKEAKRLPKSSKRPPKVSGNPQRIVKDIKEEDTKLKVKDRIGYLRTQITDVLIFSTGREFGLTAEEIFEQKEKWLEARAGHEFNDKGHIINSFRAWMKEYKGTRKKSGKSVVDGAIAEMEKLENEN